jgi:serine/threonine protein kinase
MSSFSSPPPQAYSATTFKNRMAARKRANLETQRSQQLMNRLQAKKLTKSRRASKQRLLAIQKERENLRKMLDNTENMVQTPPKTVSKTSSTSTKIITAPAANINGIITKKLSHIKRLPLLNKSNYLSSCKQQRPADLSSPGNHRNYKRVRNLGRGSFGAVSAAKNLDDGKIYAIKAIAYRGSNTVLKDRERALKEVRALKRLSDHPCIVGLRDAFESINLSKLYIVAEFCESGTLRERLESARRAVERNGWESGRLEAKLIGSWIFQLVAAVEHLHSRNTLHRDIKPANIFLCAGATQVKLGDFGLVGVLEKSMDIAKSYVGTPCYNMTPELLKNGGVSKPADMWSVGCVIHECLTLEQPYKQHGNGMSSIVNLGQNILNNVIDDHERLSYYPIGLRKLCSHDCCLSKTPEDRPTATSFLESNFILKAMKLFLNTKHITPPPTDLILLVKSKVLLGEAAKVVGDLNNLSISNCSDSKQIK